jgi:ABC-2 type transport system permease protein
MHNIWLITKREYLTRVRKKSFIVMTLLSPLLMAVFYGFIIYFSVNKNIGDTKKEIAVIDENNLLSYKIKNSENINFIYNLTSPAAATLLQQNKIYGILQIAQNSTDSATSNKPNINFTLQVNEKPSLNTLTIVEGLVEDAVKQKWLADEGIDNKLISEINKFNVKIITKKISEDKDIASDSGISTAIGFIGAFFIYLFIFLYGVQVMRGVIEEKTNRVVEVIISSVKPFDLMFGKIIGIALVGLTQFVAWVVLLIVLSSTASDFVFGLLDINATEIADNTSTDSGSSNNIYNLITSLYQFNFIGYLLLFTFYFIAGYLFYGALFAAIGSAVDNETDTQQFMLPVTLPLVLSIMLSQSLVVNAPNGAAAFWLSVIPFTSPVVMMVRAPFDIAWWQIAISISAMIAGILLTTWIAARIYRIGILSYGKKPTYSEIWKWLFTKN